MMRRHRTGIDADMLYALHVRNDNTPASKATGTNSLRLAAAAAAAADSSIETIERFDIYSDRHRQHHPGARHLRGYPRYAP